MIEYNYNGKLIKFNTDKTLLSLKGIVKGTEQLLKVVTLNNNDETLER